MGAITAKAVTGNWSVGTNWVGDVAPTAGDTVVIPSGAVITVDSATPVLGSNAAAVGYGVHIQSGGTLLVAATLNVDGYDTSSNKAVYVAPGGKLQRATGGNLVVTPASTWQTVVLNEGDFVWDGGTIESGEPWTFVERGQSLPSSYVPAGKKLISSSARISMIPLGVSGSATSGSLVGSGPVSNAAGTAVGTPLDNSFSVVSVTGGTNTPYNILQTEVESFDDLDSTGDYFVDCNNAVLYYYVDEAKSRIQCVYTVKTHQWNGFGVQSTKNAASRFLLQNATLRRLGGNFGVHNGEYTEQSVFLNYRKNGTVDSTREAYVRDCTFEYCIVPLAVYNSTNTEENPIDCTGNTIKYTPITSGNYGAYAFYVGYAVYADMSDTVFDMVQRIMGCMRASSGVKINDCTGSACCNGILPFSNITGCDAIGNVLEDTGTWMDAGGFQARGTAAAPNRYMNNAMRYGNRAGRIGSNMTITGNEFSQFFHHGLIGPASNGYFQNIRIKNNVLRESFNKDMSGGWTLGYNYSQWLDDVEIEGNTFVEGTRGIVFNDGEGSKTLGTRVKIWNNIATDNTQGLYRPAADAFNVTKMQLTRLDYNNIYGNTTDNINQGTPVKSSVEYNLDSSRNVKGIALFNASAENATGKELSLVVSGTPGTDLSMLLSWGGGTAVELVVEQGTATGGTGATGWDAANSPGTLVDTSKSWSTNALLLSQGKIVSGTGSGQYFAVRSNTATALTVISKKDDNTLIAPSTDSVYIVLKSEVEISDGSQTVLAGLYIPEVPLTAGTYTDTGITIESNALAVDPQFVSATDLTPTNLDLATAGLGGTYIGAKEPVNPDSTAPILTSATATATGATTATGSVSTDEGNGTLYFLASENATESASTIKAALSQSVTATGEQSISLEGLDPRTKYYLHIIQEDAASNESNIPTPPSFTTQDVSISLAFADDAPCSLMAFLATSNLTMSDAELKALLDGE